MSDEAAVRAERPTSHGPMRLLGLYAHPDDETFCTGGTFARYAEQGAEIMVVSATRGEAGQIRDAGIATRRTIGQVREQELRLACTRLGVQSVRCLRHRDGALARADREILVGELTRSDPRLPADSRLHVRSRWWLRPSRPRHHQRRGHGGVASGR